MVDQTHHHLSRTSNYPRGSLFISSDVLGQPLMEHLHVLFGELYGQQQKLRVFGEVQRSEQYHIANCVQFTSKALHYDSNLSFVKEKTKFCFTDTINARKL